MRGIVFASLILVALFLTFHVNLAAAQILEVEEDPIVLACNATLNCSGNGHCLPDGSCWCDAYTYGANCGACNSTVTITQTLTGTTYWGPNDSQVNTTSYSVTITAGPLAFLKNVRITIDPYVFYHQLVSVQGLIPVYPNLTVFTLPSSAYDASGYIRTGASYTFSYTIMGNSTGIISLSDGSCVAPVMPTPPPTHAPTHTPTPAPTHAPTPAPTHAPTPTPTPAPTEAPTRAPTPAPTHAPTPSPTPAPPTPAPTHAPTPAPTEAPTAAPTSTPTRAPTSGPTPTPTPSPAPPCAICPKRPDIPPPTPVIPGDNSCPTVVDQFDILTEFFYALNGQSWINNENWLSGDSVCDWYGITCNQNNDVTTIDEHNNNLRGAQIPPSIGCLPYLQGLVLDNNHIFGQIPNNLGNKPTLQYLTLANNSLGGWIPPSISKDVNLKELYLQGNGLIGEIPDLSGLYTLQELRVNDNCLTGYVPQVYSSPFIVDLFFQNNYLYGCIPDYPYKALYAGGYAAFEGNLFCKASIPCWLYHSGFQCPADTPARHDVVGPFPWCPDSSCQSEF